MPCPVNFEQIRAEPDHRAIFKIDGVEPVDTEQQHILTALGPPSSAELGEAAIPATMAAAIAVVVNSFVSMPIPPICKMRGDPKAEE
jgi:hypothetical protein